MRFRDLKTNIANGVYSIPLNLRVAWVRPVLRDYGMDVDLTVREAAGSIKDYAYGIPDIADHDISHMVANVFRANRWTILERGRKYAENLVEGQAIEVENVLFNPDNDFRSGLSTRFNTDIRTAARWGLHHRIATHIASGVKDPAAKPHLTNLHTDQLYDLIDRGITAGKFAAAVLHRNPATLNGFQLQSLPLSFFGVQMIANDEGYADRFQFYYREMRENVLDALA